MRRHCLVCGTSEAKERRLGVVLCLWHWADYRDHPEDYPAVIKIEKENDCKAAHARVRIE